MVFARYSSLVMKAMLTCPWVSVPTFRLLTQKACPLASGRRPSTSSYRLVTNRSVCVGASPNPLTLGTSLGSSCSRTRRMLGRSADMGHHHVTGRGDTRSPNPGVGKLYRLDRS